MAEQSLSEMILDNTLIKTEPYLEEDEFIEGQNEQLQLDAPDFVRIENSETVEGHLQCPQCEKIFAEQPLLDLHSEIHKFGIDNKLQTCPICNKEFNKFKPYRRHIQGHLTHFVKCPFCPEFFFSYKKHASHVSQHKKSEKLFSCSFCGKKFYSPKEQYVHERVHTNERPYECLICKKGFKQAGSLKAHVNNVHNERKDYKCEKCDGFFATSSSLHRHVRRIHDQGKSIPCKICGMAFYNYDAFYKHKTENHLEKRFFKVCPICAKPFFSKKQYTIHGTTHPDWKEKIRARQRVLRQSIPKKVIARNVDMRKNYKTIENITKLPIHKEKVESFSYFLDTNIEIKQEESPTEISGGASSKLKKIEIKQETFEDFTDDSKFSENNLVAIESAVNKKLVTKRDKILIETQKEEIVDFVDNSKFSENNLVAVESPASKKKVTKSEILENKEIVIHEIKQENVPAKIKVETNNTDHEHISHLNSAVKCLYCDEMFSNKAVCDLHHTVHTFDETIVTICPVCDKKFTMFHYYSAHIQKHIQVKLENDAKNPLECKDITECPECEKIFPNKELCDLHYTIHTFNHDEGITCSCCFKKYTTCKNYSEHIDKHIEYKTRNPTEKVEVKTEPGSALVTSVRCSTCGDEFSHQEMLDFHATIHKPEEVMKCQFCVKKYISMAFYKEHVRSHIRSCHKCKLCHSVFFIKRDFSTHMKTHNAAGKKFMCRHCPEKFPKQYKREAHECQVHNIENGKRFTCARCLKEFYEVGSYHAHMRYVYTCQDCNQVFCKIDTLKNHRIAEHPEIPYKLQCKKCDVNFSGEREYRMHFLERHSKSFSDFLLSEGQGTSGGNYSEFGTDEDYSTRETLEYESDCTQASSSPEKKLALFFSSSESTSESLSPEKKVFNSEFEKSVPLNMQFKKEEPFDNNKSSELANPLNFSELYSNLEAAGSSKVGDSGETDIGYRCEQCGKTFSRIIYFRKHLKNHLFFKGISS